MGCKQKYEAKNFKLSSTDSIALVKKNNSILKQIDSITPYIQNADLILRTGNDFTSESLKNLNQRSKLFSHCGIASIENDSVFVYHSLGGEWNPDQKILREPILSFANPTSNKAMGWYRFNLSKQERENVLIFAKQFKKIGVTFDMKFDLQSFNKMYCAEFVYNCYQLGTAKKLLFPLSKIGNFQFVGVDDIFLNPSCKNIKNFTYTN